MNLKKEGSKISPVFTFFCESKGNFVCFLTSLNTELKRITFLMKLENFFLKVKINSEKEGGKFN